MGPRLWRRTAAGPQHGLLASLMALALLLFLVGVVGEHQVRASHPTAGGQHTTEAGSAPDSGGDRDSAAPRTGDTPATTAQAETGSERVFGIAVDDPAVVTASALAWLVLFAAVLRFGRQVLPVVLLAAAAALVLDLGEVVRQVGEAQSGLAFLAALIAAGHGVVALLALMALVRPWRSPAAAHTPRRG